LREHVLDILGNIDTKKLLLPKPSDFYLLAANIMEALAVPADEITNFLKEGLKIEDDKISKTEIEGRILLLSRAEVRTVSIGIEKDKEGRSVVQIESGGKTLVLSSNAEEQARQLNQLVKKSSGAFQAEVKGGRIHYKVRVPSVTLDVKSPTFPQELEKVLHRFYKSSIVEVSQKPDSIGVRFPSEMTDSMKTKGLTDVDTVVDKLNLWTGEGRRAITHDHLIILDLNEVFSAEADRPQEVVEKLQAAFYRLGILKPETQAVAARGKKVEELPSKSAVELRKEKITEAFGELIRKFNQLSDDKEALNQKETVLRLDPPLEGEIEATLGLEVITGDLNSWFPVSIPDFTQELELEGKRLAIVLKRPPSGEKLEFLAEFVSKILDILDSVKSQNAEPNTQELEKNFPAHQFTYKPSDTDETLHELTVQLPRPIVDKAKGKIVARMLEKEEGDRNVLTIYFDSEYRWYDILEKETNLLKEWQIENSEIPEKPSFGRLGPSDLIPVGTTVKVILKRKPKTQAAPPVPEAVSESTVPEPETGKPIASQLFPMSAEDV